MKKGRLGKCGEKERDRHGTDEEGKWTERNKGMEKKYGRRVVDEDEARKGIIERRRKGVNGEGKMKGCICKRRRLG